MEEITIEEENGMKFIDNEFITDASTSITILDIYANLYLDIEYKEETYRIWVDGSDGFSKKIGKYI